jgi:hypothetical protein
MAETAAAVALHRLAHARAGDKGNRLNISVIAYDPADFDLLAAGVTEARVRELFADRRPRSVVRYALPELGALNFVLDDLLEGGVNRSLNLDTHGKTLSFRLLALELAIPGDHPAVASRS